jgi:hypothetical protein
MMDRHEEEREEGSCGPGSRVVLHIVAGSDEEVRGSQKTQWREVSSREVSSRERWLEMSKRVEAMEWTEEKEAGKPEESFPLSLQ